MFGKFKEGFKRKELDEDKKNIEFEKGDFLALLIAAGSVMIPILLLIFLSIAIMVWILF
jgi:hypothetical protein